jgi:hypothetical protein
LYALNKVIETYDLSQLLKLGYSYEVVVSGSLTSVGSVETIIESFVLYNESGIDVTSEFDITYENGKLDIFGRVIKIFLYKLQKYYDGDALSYADDDWELITELGANEELILDIMISLTNVGRLTLSDINMNIDDYIKYKYYKDGVDCSANVSIVVDIFDDMDISGEYVPIEVNKLDIEITTGSASKVYDGKPLRDGEVYISKGSLNFGDKLQAYTSGVITEIGEVDNTIETYKIINQNGEDVTDNYNIIIKKGTLTVTPPGVTL